MKSKLSIFLCSGSVALLLLSGCSGTPEGVLGKDELASLLADLYVGESFTVLETNSFDYSSLDSTRKVLRQSILQQHGLTQAEFDSTLNWYGHNLDRYEQVCDLVIEDLTERKKGRQDASDEPVEDNSLWEGAPAVRITEKGAGIILDISPSLQKGDRVTWQFKTHNQTAPLDALLAVEYADGSTGYAVRSLSSSPLMQNINLQTDTALSPKRIYGYVHSRQNQPLILDSIKVSTSSLNPTLYYEINTQRKQRSLKK